MNSIIKVKVKTVYGNRLVYPVCQRAQLLAEIAGTKTFSKDVLLRIKQLGYTVEVQADTLDELLN